MYIRICKNNIWNLWPIEVSHISLFPSMHDQIRLRESQRLKKICVACIFVFNKECHKLIWTSIAPMWQLKWWHSTAVLHVKSALFPYTKSTPITLLPWKKHCYDINNHYQKSHYIPCTPNETDVLFRYFVTCIHIILYSR